MATKKKTSPAERRRKAATRKAAAGVREAGTGLRQTWDATLSALTAAEEEMQRQIALLLRRNKITTKDASGALKDLSSRIERERRKAMKDLDARMSTLQTRLRKERKNLGRAVDDAVHGALATFNIPSRQEVAELTRKVDELSRKIDAFRRPAARPRTASRRAPASVALRVPEA